MKLRMVTNFLLFFAAITISNTSLGVDFSLHNKTSKFLHVSITCAGCDATPKQINPNAFLDKTFNGVSADKIKVKVAEELGLGDTIMIANLNFTTTDPKKTVFISYDSSKSPSFFPQTGSLVTKAFSGFNVLNNIKQSEINITIPSP